MRTYVVRYFERPESYWEGHHFNMLQHSGLARRLREDFAGSVELREPTGWLSEAEMRRCVSAAHSGEYMARIERYFERPDDAMKEFEVPCSRQIFRTEVMDVGGTVAACLDAAESESQRFGFNIGGGYHHAFPAHGEGFCILNDVAIAIQELKRRSAQKRRYIVLDLDVHQGNGVASFFPPRAQDGGYAVEEEYRGYRGAAGSGGGAGGVLPRPAETWTRSRNVTCGTEDVSYEAAEGTWELAQGGDRASGTTPVWVYRSAVAAPFLHEDVLTVSLHNEDNYPWYGQSRGQSCLDVGLPAKTGDRVYLAELEEALQWVHARLQQEARASPGAEPLVLYIAGADPYEHDSLGGLRISKEGMKARDERVFRFCREHGLRVAVVLAGGYAPDVEDLIGVRLNTFRALLEFLG